MKLKSWRAHGTHDFADWIHGERVTRIEDVNVGDVLFNDSEQFQALNLCVVTRKDADRGIAYATLCSPEDPTKGRPGGAPEPEFAIWNHEFEKSHFGNRFLRASRGPEAVPCVLCKWPEASPLVPFCGDCLKHVELGHQNATPTNHQSTQVER